MRHVATLSLFAFLFASVYVAQAQCDCPPVADRPIVTVSAGGTGTTSWTCDNTYVIDGYVFVRALPAMWSEMIRRDSTHTLTVRRVAATGSVRVQCSTVLRTPCSVADPHCA